MHRLLLVALALLVVSTGVQAQHTDSLFYGDTKTLIPNPYGWDFPPARTPTLTSRNISPVSTSTGDADAYVVGAHVYFAFKRIVDYPDTVWIVARDAAPDGSRGYFLTSSR